MTFRAKESKSEERSEREPKDKSSGNVCEQGYPGAALHRINYTLGGKLTDVPRHSHQTRVSQL